MNELLLLYFVGGILVLMVLLGLGVAIVMPSIDPYNRRFFITAFLILLLCIIIIFGEVLIYQKPAYNFLEKVICFFSFLFPSLLTLLMALHLLHASGENWRTSVLSITGFVLMVSLVLFGFTTILGWDYYSERCIEYLSGGKMGVVKVYRWLYILAVFIGPYMTISQVWTIADIFNALMAIPNCICLIALVGVIAKLSKDFFVKKQ